MKFLLQQQEWKASGERAGYLDTRSPLGRTPLLWSIEACSPRITRMLVDAGADTMTAVRLTTADGSGRVVFNGTPLAFAGWFLSVKRVRREDATESQLHSWEAIRRLLMRVEAVHAVCWLWTSDAPPVAHAAEEGSGRAVIATSTPLVSMLPILRRRAGRPRVLLAALFRWVVMSCSKKPCLLCFVLACWFIVLYRNFVDVQGLSYQHSHSHYCAPCLYQRLRYSRTCFCF